MTRRQKTEFGLELCKWFRHHYGIPWLPRTVMAVLLQCSTEAVRQIEARALRKIRRALTPDDFELLNYIFQCDRTVGRPRLNGCGH